MSLRAATAMLLALAIPGAGHAFLGKRDRAIGFFLVVWAMFLIGIAIDGGLYLFELEGYRVLRLVAAVASMGSGILYATAVFLGVDGVVISATYEYGRTFTLTAGVMNLLLVLDCFDIVAGRRS